MPSRLLAAAMATTLSTAGTTGCAPYVGYEFAPGVKAHAVCDTAGRPRGLVHIDHAGDSLAVKRALVLLYLRQQHPDGCKDYERKLEKDRAFRLAQERRADCLASRNMGACELWRNEREAAADPDSP